MAQAFLKRCSQALSLSFIATLFAIAGALQTSSIRGLSLSLRFERALVILKTSRPLESSFKKREKHTHTQSPALTPSLSCAPRTYFLVEEIRMKVAHHAVLVIGLLLVLQPTLNSNGRSGAGVNALQRWDAEDGDESWYSSFGGIRNRMKKVSEQHA